MKGGLLIVERMAIECLAKGPKNIFKVSEDTGLSSQVATNVLYHLVENGVVSFKNSQYSLNEEKREQWLSVINDQAGIINEMKDVFVSMINESFENEEETQFRYRKVWMTRRDEKIFKSYLKNIETFLDGLRERPEMAKIRDQKLIIWGFGKYSDVVKANLKSVG